MRIDNVLGVSRLFPVSEILQVIHKRFVLKVPIDREDYNQATVEEYTERERRRECSVYNKSHLYTYS